jgi:hypothetical protein
MKRIYITTLLIGLVGLLNLTAQERIYTPELSLPLNNAVNQTPDVVLDWNAVTGGNTGIIQYDVQLDTDPAFPSPEIFQTEFLTAVQMSELIFGETYYWHVRAKDGNDISGWSETRSFRVVRRVVLTGPNDASLLSDTVNLQWAAISGITEYEYQLDTVYFWKPINSGVTANLLNVAVVDDTHTWIVGAAGLILFGDGTSWTEQESNLSTDLHGASFVDINNGWAAGKGGKIIKYDGTAWTTQTSGTTNDLYAIDMLDASNGWAVGKSGVIMHFDGTAWSLQETATKDLNSVFAVDASHVWAAGKGGLVMFYNGSSWAIQETGSIKDFSSIGFTSANEGWVVGKTGTFYQYSNGAWSEYKQELTTKDLTGVFFIDADNGYVVGKQGTLMNFDGIDWSSQSSTVTTNFNSVSFAGATGYLVGENGTIIAYNDEAFTSPMAVIRNASGDTTLAKVSELLFGTQYYWRMRAKHDLDISEWSGARSFNTRAGVTLDKPLNNATNTDLDQLLQWKNQFSPAVNYEVQLDDDANFGTPITMPTSEISINAEFLQFGTLYNWRVRAMHGEDISDWSNVWKFTTTNTVELISPVNNEVDVKISPVLTWEEQTGLAGFNVQLASSNSFGEPLVNDIVPAEESSYIVPLVLDKDAVYYWRVRGVNGLDTSGWSPTWSFRTTPPVGIDEPGLSSKFSIYPNPVVNTLYLQLLGSQATTCDLTITDIVGITVKEQKFTLAAGNKTVTVDASMLKEGMYLLRISDNINSFTKKIIIKR